MVAEKFWDELSAWSQKTFGGDEVRGCIGPLKHLRKEVQEAIDAYEAGDVDGCNKEIVDCLFLSFDSARRAGLSFEQLFAMAFDKLKVNQERQWSAPTTDEPVEHVRS